MSEVQWRDEIGSWVRMSQIIVFMVTQSLIALVIALAMILGLIFHFPTRSSVINWIEEQLVIVEQERSLGSA